MIRLLRRLGLLPYNLYTCNHCGYTVPLKGSRWAQAMAAVDHSEDAHDDLWTDIS